MAAAEAWEFAVTIPAGTPIGAPVTVPCVLPTRIIRSIRWRVPPGHKGLTGWRVLSSNTQVIPASAGAWMVTDAQSGTFDLPGLPDSGDWQVAGYNTGSFAHTVYVTFVAAVIEKPPGLITLHPNSVLSSAPDLSTAGRPLRRRP